MAALSLTVSSGRTLPLERMMMNIDADNSYGILVDFVLLELKYYY
jgi:hypothetical protein